MNKAVIKYENGRVQELTVNGVDMKKCYKAELSMSPFEMPILTLAFHLAELDAEIEDCKEVIERV